MSAGTQAQLVSIIPIDAEIAIELFATMGLYEVGHLPPQAGFEDEPNLICLEGPPIAQVRGDNLIQSQVVIEKGHPVILRNVIQKLLQGAFLSGMSFGCGRACRLAEENRFDELMPELEAQVNAADALYQSNVKSTAAQAEPIIAKVKGHKIAIVIQI